jgi:hypothetical protein
MGYLMLRVRMNTQHVIILLAIANNAKSLHEDTKLANTFHIPITDVLI